MRTSFEYWTLEGAVALKLKNYSSGHVFFEGIRQRCVKGWVGTWCLGTHLKNAAELGVEVTPFQRGAGSN